MLAVPIGLAAVAAIPAAVVGSEVYERWTLLESSVSIAPAALLGLLAVVLGRRARRSIERTIGRMRGARAAALGRFLGYLALYLAVTGGISLATYYVLREFAA